MSVVTSAAVTAVVENIAAAVIYDAGKAGVRKVLSPRLQKELKQYLQDQYGDDRMVLDAVKERLRLDSVYEDAIRVRGDSAKLLEWRMEGCPDASSEERVRAAFKGCVDIMLAEVETWPEYQRRITGRIASDVAETRRDVEQVKHTVSGIDLKMSEQRREVSPAGQPIVRDRTDEYIRRWTDPLFLNRSDGFDDVREVHPCDVHVPYRYETAKGTWLTDEKKLLNWLSGSKGHLVLGDPGIGKSTLITWFLNTGSNSDKAKVYQLSDFKLNGQENDFGDTLMEKMGITLEQLKKGILFLDGLDECGLSPEDRYWFLEQLHQRWGDAFPWVVTCRLNYITTEDRQERIVGQLQGITLLPLGEEQIVDYLDRYHEASGEEIPDEKRKALVSAHRKGKYGSPFGIPLLLYMVAASSEVMVTKNSSLVDVYEQLFPALFERKYDSHKHPVVGSIQEELRQISRDIALYMLLHNSDAATIPETAYREIEGAFGDTIPADAGKFGSYFRSAHITEGESELCFIHRTMYEYFVADGFVHLAVHAKTPEELSGVIAWYWHKERIDTTMEQYVKEKLTKNKADKEKLGLSFWENAGLEMMKRGVRRSWQGIQEEQTSRKKEWAVPACLHPAEGDELVDDRKMENTAFWNLCHLLVWVREITGCLRMVYEEEDGGLVEKTIRHCSADNFPVFFERFYLRGVMLCGVNLPGADLSGVILSDANLRGANLSGANLLGANLSGANLLGADLRGAYMLGADLHGANLLGADLSGAILSDANLGDANLSVAILHDANLSDANLGGADLRRAFLRDANLSGADLSGANLSSANLRDADLTGADLTYARFSECQIVNKGFDDIASCRFSVIIIHSTYYPRRQFFDHFFPDHPYPGDNPIPPKKKK